MHPDHDDEGQQAPTRALPARTALDPAGDSGVLPAETRLGRYRIQSLIGRGGMGEVYLAEQIEPVRRMVALKLSRAQRLDARHLAWFEIERQMLAQMQHPAIAQIHDAGTTPDGYPYFAMEYIEGQPITQYCEARRLGLRDRLALMINVCEGVQHAHQRGVIHRDLKPGNILVGETDARPSPKIIDFGIATTTSRSPVGEAPERAGTPDYMSPEQAGAIDLDIDTRSDVYSLGVVLYELLSGQRPSGDDATRTPSRKLASLAPEQRTAIAQSRDIEADRLIQTLRHELDWVVMKAIRRDRDERYSSVSAFAEDLRAFLESRPLLAVPATRRYRIGKFVRRHRLVLGAAASIAIAIFGGLALSVYGLMQARQQRAVAETRRHELEQVVSFQQSMLEGIDVAAMGQAIASGERAQRENTADDPGQQISTNWTDIARGTLDSQLLERALTTIDRDFRAQPVLAADLRESVADVQSALGLYKRASGVYAEVLRVREGALQAGDPKILRAMWTTADAMIKDGRAQEAQPLIERALSLATRVSPDAGAERMKIEQVHASMLYDLGRIEQARDRLQALHARAKKARGEHDETTLSILSQWADAQLRMGEIKDGRAAFETIYAYRLKTAGIDDPRTESAMAKLGPARGMDNDFDGSLALTDALIGALTRKLGAEHPDTLGLINTRVTTLTRAGRFEDARASLDALVENARRVLGPAHPRTLRYMQNQASLSARMKDYVRAVELQRSLFDARKRALGENHPDTLLSQVSLASILADAGRLGEAIAIGVDGCARMVATLGEAHPNASGCHKEVGSLKLEAGEPAAAAALLERALSAQQGKDGPTAASTVETALYLHDAYRALGNNESRTRLRERNFTPFLALPQSDLDPKQRDLRPDVEAVLRER